MVTKTGKKLLAGQVYNTWYCTKKCDYKFVNINSLHKNWDATCRNITRVILCAIAKVAEVVNEGGKILLQMVRKEEPNRYK